MGHHEELFVSTTPGLEPLVERELGSFGETVERLTGGVRVVGRPGLHRELNLRLRTATRVLMRVGRFQARNEPSLVRGLVGLPLDAYAAKRAAIGFVWSGRPWSSAVRARAEKQLRQKWNLAPQAALTGLALLVRQSGEGCEVSVDTTGELLHRRGYRQELSRAPLRETLAAGVLLLAGYDGTEPFWDPMCGSGTIAIEAALIATRRAPGLERKFAFEQWPTFDRRAWDETRRVAASEARRAPASLWASDLNAGALGTARRNARRAGVLEEIGLFRQNLLHPERAPPGKTGLLVANLPYGKRLGGEGDLGALYERIGKSLRAHWQSWRWALLVPKGPLGARLGLAFDEVFRLENGGLECELLVCQNERFR